ncbi:MAG: helicase UvrD [Bacteroidetes bacterium]|nr:helicase UvrD [Bacteroidota bacterium]
MFTVYTASAGSGKTSRLVVEYLALALPNPRKYKHILAITFTNNATAEMKGRILDILKSFAFETYDQLPGSLKATYQEIQKIIDPKNPDIPFELYLRKKSTELLQEILYDYDNFSISTIDTFFQKILRAFSFELGLNMNYTLEIQLDELHEQTVDLLLNKLSVDNKELSQRMLTLIESKIEESGKWKVEQDLIALLQNIFNEDSYFAIQALSKLDKSEFDKSALQINILRRKYKARIKEISKEYQTIVSQTNADQKLFDKFLKEIDCFSPDFFYEHVNKKYKKGIPPDLESHLQQFIQLLESLKQQHDLLKELTFFGKNLTQLALLIDLKMVIEEIKEQDNLFYLSETNGIIHDKIQEDDTPFIYEKMGNKFSYFFLDEFQDTSKLQMENLIPLIQNALSGYNEFKEKGETFLFGDVKQAIYRFRNGDSSLLYKLSQFDGYQELINPLGASEEEFQLKLLDQNYRSSLSIVDFNNQFFQYVARLSNFEGLETYYQDVVQKPDPGKDQGLVSIRFKNDKDNKDTTQYLLEQTLKTIQQLVAEQIPYGDMAVLVSSNKLGSSMGEFLSRNSVPVISSDSLMLSSSQEVMVIISSLYYLQNSNNKIARMMMGHFLIRNYPELQNELFKNLKDELDFYQFLNRFDVQIAKEEWLNTPLFTLVNKIISIFKITENDPFVIMFLDQVDQFLKNSNGSIQNFIDWWEQNAEKLTLNAPTESNAVTISTIHKSKGLAYPIVIFPFTQYGYKYTKSDYWIKDEKKVTGLPYSWVQLKNDDVPDSYQYLLESEKRCTALDQLNKLYVVHTRPKDRLYIITKEKKAGNYSKFLDQFISEHYPENQEDFFQYYYTDNQYYTELPASSQIQKKAHSNNHKTDLAVSQVFVSPFTLSSAFLAFDFQKSWNEEQERGIFIHQFLSELKRFPENEAEVEFLIQETPEMYQEYLKKLLIKLITDFEYAPYFKNDLSVLNETSIISTDGTLLRPDRVIFLEDEVVVIDYKTGAPLPKHQEQIDLYCSKLMQMGYQKVVGKLIYL